MAKINVAYWYEKMSNRLPGRSIRPENKFQVLQAGDGHPLLFSVGTDGVFYLARQQGDTLSGGLSITDLSTPVIAREFGESGVSCRTFASGQNAQDGSVSLALVITTPLGDHLYLSLGNSCSNLAWLASPNWVRYEPGQESGLQIVDVFFCETVDKSQYIVVDRVRDTNSSVKKISRFYIDPDKKTGEYWIKRDLAVDVEVEGFHNCLGRAQKDYVDGLYTFGFAGEIGQFVFCPLENSFGDTAPLPARLNLPGSAMPTAIAATRNTDLSTDLFAVSGNTLFYLSSTNQAERKTGSTLVSNDMISGTSELTAMNQNGVVTLWGRNGSNQVYWLTAPQPKVADPSAWSLPLPVAAGVERMSPYINRADGGSAIFAAGAGKLHVITADAGPAPKSWKTNQITLPDLPSGKAVSFESYTITLNVTDDQNLPLKGATVSLSASKRCAIYINGIYFNIGEAPIQVTSDSLGFITIIEGPTCPVDTTFTVHTGSGPDITINPHALLNTFTVCFSGTACTRDEGEKTRDGSDTRIYCGETGYIPVRIHKEISGTLEATNPSITVRGVGENDWCQPRNSSEALVLDGPLKAPSDLLGDVRKYSGGNQRSFVDGLDGWAAEALALHAANLAVASGAKRFNFIGHSRGAVEAIMAAWFIYAYGPRDVTINIFAIDPVPGPGKWYGILTQLPPNVAHYVGIYAWDQCVQIVDKPFMAVVPRPNRRMTSQADPNDPGGRLGDTWDSLADACQLANPLDTGNAPQPQGYELYACRGRHSTVAGNTTGDGAYDPNNVRESVAPVGKLVYKLARAYLTQWGTTFRSKSATEETVLELRKQIHTDHAKFDAMGGGATRTSMLAYRPFVRRVSSISGRDTFNSYYMDNVVGDPPYKLTYPVTNERTDTGWVNWKFL